MKRETGCRKRSGGCLSTVQVTREMTLLATEDSSSSQEGGRMRELEEELEGRHKF